MSSLKTGPSKLGMHLVAIPVAVSVIVFLGYSSQWLFNTASALEPGPLSTTESVVFNSLLGCLWWSYLRACTVNPGRYIFDVPGTSDEEAKTSAKEMVPRAPDTSEQSRPGSSSSSGSSSHAPTAGTAVRWCRKCDAPKPARSHHCRHCRRCIPKMDHHCPWTGNCVSMQTFPHFVRFIMFTNVSLWMLAYLIGCRFYWLYAQRYLPAYLGPTMPQLVHLTVLGLVCGGATLALSIMLYTTVQSWMFNATMIEGWEIERHEAVVDRYSSTSPDGSWWDDDDEDDYEGEDDDDDKAGYGDYDEDEEDERAERRERKARKAAALRMRIEFPYDLGIFNNMAQSMGTRNVLLWFLPFAGGPKIATASGSSGLGWDWPENGFNDRTGMWPPPDPEKLRHAAAQGQWPAAAAAAGATSGGGSSTAFTSGRDEGDRQWGTPEEEKAAFLARQQADFRRRRLKIAGPVRQVGSDDEFEQGMDGEPGWTNADGDRLRDYGVDEEAENDEDVPIATLLQRRDAKAKLAAVKSKSDKYDKKKQ
ncbi:Palmitoyltransferase [Sporothrix curviconia]|uniref:Palmitoyltransferase PFA4 n=1 Tax=Sporothrix curviconia TaxID=1260050 RepID=A0ABP0C6H3_9PEZI